MCKPSYFPGWKTTACLLIFSVIGFSAAVAGSLQADLSTEIGIISGTTDYSVGGGIATAEGRYSARFPLSRLVFPIDAYLFTISAGLTWNDRLSGSFSWSRNVTDEPGKMRDYDWEASSGRLYIYSESDLDMTAETVSGEIRYAVFQLDLDQYSAFFRQGDRWHFLVGVHYLYQQFDFNAYDTRQTYPGQNIASDFVPGRTLAYAVDYLIPLVKLDTAYMAAGGSSLELSFGYSPYTRAADKDRHLLRDMRSEADCKGTAFMISCNLTFRFSKHWFAALRLSHLEIEADGTSRAVIDNEWDHTIDTILESRQSLAALRIGAGF